MGKSQATRGFGNMFPFQIGYSYHFFIHSWRFLRLGLVSVGIIALGCVIPF